MDFYNMSSAISNGDMRSGAIDGMNDNIKIQNKAKVDAAKGAVSQDKSLGVMEGIKSGIGEAAAGSQAMAAVSAYKSAIKAPAGAAGWSEVKTVPSDFTPPPAQAGEEVSSFEGKAASAITTSKGVVGEGSDIAVKGGAFAVGETESLGSKLAGGIGKGVGLAGAVGTAGLDIAQDIKAGGLAGDNWEEKVSNLGNIGGAALDMVGLIPGFQLAGVFGAGLSAASGVLSAAGEAVDTVKKVASDSAPVQQQQLTAQQTLAGSVASQRS